MTPGRLILVNNRDEADHVGPNLTDRARNTTKKKLGDDEGTLIYCPTTLGPRMTRRRSLMRECPFVVYTFMEIRIITLGQ